MLKRCFCLCILLSGLVGCWCKLNKRLNETGCRLSLITGSSGHRDRLLLAAVTLVSLLAAWQWGSSTMAADCWLEIWQPNETWWLIWRQRGFCQVHFLFPLSTFQRITQKVTVTQSEPVFWVEWVLCCSQFSRINGLNYPLTNSNVNTSQRRKGTVAIPDLSSSWSRWWTRKVHVKIRGRCCFWRVSGPRLEYSSCAFRFAA